MVPCRRNLHGLGRAATAALLLATTFTTPVRAAGGEVWLCLTETRGAHAEIARLLLGPDRTFELSFIHSVSRTPVRDRYQVVEGEILQTRETFMAHGAGLPSIANDLDTTGWRHEDGQFILEMRRPTGPVPLRIQAQYKNTLHIAGTDLALADLGRNALTLAPCDEENTH